MAHKVWHVFHHRHYWKGGQTQRVSLSDCTFAMFEWMGRWTAPENAANCASTRKLGRTVFRVTQIIPASEETEQITIRQVSLKAGNGFGKPEMSLGLPACPMVASHVRVAMLPEGCSRSPTMGMAGQEPPCSSNTQLNPPRRWGSVEVTADLVLPYLPSLQLVTTLEMDALRVREAVHKKSHTILGKISDFVKKTSEAPLLYTETDIDASRLPSSRGEAEGHINKIRSDLQSSQGRGIRDLESTLDM
jgi:hypothetical protein